MVPPPFRLPELTDLRNALGIRSPERLRVQRPGKPWNAHECNRNQNMHMLNVESTSIELRGYSHRARNRLRNVEELGRASATPYHSADVASPAPRAEMLSTNSALKFSFRTCARPPGMRQHRFRDRRGENLNAITHPPHIKKPRRYSRARRRHLHGEYALSWKRFRPVHGKTSCHRRHRTGRRTGRGADNISRKKDRSDWKQTKFHQ